MSRHTQVLQRTVFLSFVVPVYNEEKNIKLFLDQLRPLAESMAQQFEVIFVDDGSTDTSLQLLRELAKLDARIRYMSFSRNFGKEMALTAGLRKARGDVAIMIDVDMQHPVEVIETFLGKWAEGYDMVYGLRDHRRHESIIKRFFLKIFYRLMGVMSKTKVPPNAGDFRLVDRCVIDALNACSETNRFMKGLYAWVGFRSTGVTYQVQQRRRGSSSFSFFRLLALAMTGLTSFSEMPLRVWSLVGAAISGASLIYALVIVLETLIRGVHVPGYATISVSIMFFGGVQLISIGILGEYIGRIFREVKNRPPYIVMESSTGTESTEVQTDGRAVSDSHEQQ